ncbi:MAG: NADH-quinone oxidoreductase subunit J [Chloroflexota bacterium]|nr:NADH-quinone oxidoreductase subunit J [Chloroflexota bacterium]
MAALLVVTLRNVFRAALALIVCFLTIAGIYITLSADFLAAVQVLVYVGAISVLIILAIMMTKRVTEGSPSNELRVPAAIIAVIAFGVVSFAMLNTAWRISPEAPTQPTTFALAGRLFGVDGFVLPVEIAGVLLLTAIIGAIILARDK